MIGLGSDKNGYNKLDFSVTGLNRKVNLTVTILKTLLQKKIKI